MHPPPAATLCHVARSGQGPPCAWGRGRVMLGLPFPKAWRRRNERAVRTNPERNYPNEPRKRSLSLGQELTRCESSLRPVLQCSRQCVVDALAPDKRELL